MLAKLAFKNARRSMRDYSVYLLTVTIVFSLMYAFNMVFFSKDIISLHQMFSALPLFIAALSVIVIAVTEWLVHYMNRFMLEKRSRELGTYMLLGIGARKISRMILLENMILGAASFLAGLLFGTFFYQVLAMTVMNLFEVRYSPKVEFSLPAVLLTLLYVVFIYALSVLRLRGRLNKMKICDLIYAEKQNETAVVSKRSSHVLLFASSLFALALGCGLIYFIFRNDSALPMKLVLAGFALIIGGLYGVYIEFAAFLVKLFLGKRERKYAKDNLFLYRNLSAKLKTMSFTMGTLALLITLTLTCTQSAMLFNQYFELSAQNRCTFDVNISVEGEDKPDFSREIGYFRDSRGIRNTLTVPVYSCGQTTLYDALQVYSYANEDYAISYSDYAALRKMLGYEPVDLKDNSYILHALPQISQAADKTGGLFYTVNGKTLSLQASYCQPLSQEGYIGVGYVIVLPDELTEGLKTGYTTLVIDTLMETTEGDREFLHTLYSEREDLADALFIDADTLGGVLADSRAAIIIFSFGLYYTGLIFICAAATILAVQQLSEASKYRFRYDILSKLGVQDEKIGRLVLKQLLLYFGIPLLLPIPLSIFLTLCVRNILLGVITSAFFWTSVFTGLGLFFLIYALYFAATYVGYKRSVL